MSQRSGASAPGHDEATRGAHSVGQQSVGRPAPGHRSFSETRHQGSD